MASEADQENRQVSLPWNGAGTDCADEDLDGNPDFCPPPPSADINGDGVVNAEDLAIMLNAWGDRYPPADLNRNGEVEGADLAILLAYWKI